MLPYKTVLIIAGSDPSGGAGIQADIKTCTAHGVYAMTAITALTAQNTTGVKDILDTTGFLEAQLDAILSDIRPDALKIGMLPSAHAVSIVVSAIRRHALRNVVLDPVMAATSGNTLSPHEAVDAMLRELLPLASVVTPNIPEAERITGRRIMSDADIPRAAYDILNTFHPGSVLIKGGHLDHPDRITDYWYDHGGAHTEHIHERVNTANTHGTGCTLSSAIAANLALGYATAHAVARAQSWLLEALKAGSRRSLGHGHGPVDHMFALRPKH